MLLVNALACMRPYYVLMLMMVATAHLWVHTAIQQPPDDVC
jgi:hypothetical protein